MHLALGRRTIRFIPTRKHRHEHGKGMNPCKAKRKSVFKKSKRNISAIFKDNNAVVHDTRSLITLKATISIGNSHQMKKKIGKVEKTMIYFQWPGLWNVYINDTCT